MTTTDFSSGLLAPGPSARRRVRPYGASSLLDRLLHWIDTWEERRQLHALPDRLLDDVGLRRDQIDDVLWGSIYPWPDGRACVPDLLAWTVGESGAWWFLQKEEWLPAQLPPQTNLLRARPPRLSGLAQGSDRDSGTGRAAQPQLGMALVLQTMVSNSHGVDLPAQSKTPL